MDEFLKLALAVITGGAIVQIAQALKMRSDSRREDRKQHIDEAAAVVTNAATVVNAAGTVVKLHDTQAQELLDQIEILRIELREQRQQSQKEREAFQQRLTDAESRIARAERRAGESEKQANDFRLDVIRLGEQLNTERIERQTELKRERTESQGRINKLVLIIETLFDKLKKAGIDPGFSMDDLKQMYALEKQHQDA